MPAVAAFAVAAFGAVSAGAAVATALGVTSFLGLSVATWSAIGMVGMAVSALALGLSMSSMMPKPSSTGTQLNMKLTGNDPLPVAYGRTATGGTVVYRETFGKKDGANETLAMLVALSVGGAIAGFDGVLANDYTLGLTGSVGSLQTVNAVSGQSYKSKMFTHGGKFRMVRRVGATPETQTPSEYAGVTLPKTPGKLSGIAHAVMLLDYSTNTFPQGVPKVVHVVRGQRVYDPRLDDTYPGGEGDHRIDDPDTWEFSENPHLCALNWTLGRVENDVLVYGIGATPAEVDLSAFVAGANIADELGWKVGGVVQTTDDKFAVLGTLLQAGGAVPVARGAQISCVTNTARSSIFSITSEHVIGSAEIINSTAFRDRKNHITPRYRAESQFWQITNGEPVTASTYVEEDGGELRSTEAEYPFVQDATQAHQLAAYDLVNGREFLQLDLTTKPELMAVRAGDCVTVTLPDLALDDQKFLVVSREFDPGTWTVKLSLRAETDAKHAFALGQTAEAPPSPALNTFDPSWPEPPESGTWTVTETSISTGSGSNAVTTPAIVIEGASDEPTATQVLFEHRRPLVFEGEAPSADEQAEMGWLGEVAVDASASRGEITAGLLPATDYEVGVSYRTVLGIKSQRLILGPVTTGEQRVGSVTDGGIDWTANTISNFPVAISDLDANGLIWANNVVFENAVTVHAQLANVVVDLGAAYDELGALSDQVAAYDSDLGDFVDQVAVQAAIASSQANAAQANAGLAASHAGNAISAASNAVASEVAATLSANASAANASIAVSNAGLAASHAENAISAASNAVASQVAAALSANASAANASIAVSNAGLAANYAGWAASNVTLAQTQVGYATANVALAFSNATLAASHAANSNVAANLATTQAAYATANAALVFSNVALAAAYTDAATTVVSTTLPSTFEGGLGFWTETPAGSTASVATMANGTLQTVSTIGQTWRATGYHPLHTKGIIPVADGRSYRLSAKFRQFSDPTTGGSIAGFGFIPLDADLRQQGPIIPARTSAGSSSVIALAAAQGWQTVVAEFADTTTRTNYWLNSATGTSWEKTGLNTPTATTALGGNAAWLFTVSGAGTLGYVSGDSIAVEAGQPVTFTVYLRGTAANSTFVLGIDGSVDGWGDDDLIFYNTDIGTVAPTLSGGLVTVAGVPTSTSASIVNRVRITRYSTVAQTVTPRVYLKSAVAGDIAGTETGHIAGPQFEIGDTASPYLVSTATAATQTIQTLARTNRQPWSQNLEQWTVAGCTVTPAAATAPDGTMTACRITDTFAISGDVITYRINNFTVYAGRTYTFSGFVKHETCPVLQARGGNGLTTFSANFDLANGVVGSKGAAITSHSMTAVGDGWYRWSLTGVAAGTTIGGGEIVLQQQLSATADIADDIVGAGRSYLLWGIQVEENGWASPYIPTGATAVTVNDPPAYLRPVIFGNYGSTNGDGAFEVAYLKFEDVTESTAANSSVTLATTQAGYANANAALASSNASLAATFAGYANDNAAVAANSAGHSASNAAISTTQAGFASANASLATSNATLSATFAGYAAANAGLAATSAGYSAANATISTTQAGFASANASLATSNATLSATFAGHAAANATTAQTAAGYSASNAAISTAQAGFASANASLATSNATLSATFAGYAAANAGLAATSAGYSASNATISTTQAGFANSNAALASSNATLAATFSGYAAANAGLAATSAGYSASNATISSTQAGFASANASLASSNATLAATHSGYAAANAAAASTQAGYSASNATISTTQAGFASANASLATSNATLSATFAGYAAANAGLAATSAGYSASNATISTTQAGFASANASLATSNATLAATFSGYAAANAGLAATSAGYSASNATISSTQAGFASANASLATSNATLAATHSGYAAANAAAASTQAGYSASNATISTTQAGFASANASLASSNATLSATFAGYAAANAAAASTQAGYSAANATISTAQAGFANSNAALATSNATLAATYSGYAAANATTAQTAAGYSASNATISTSQAGFASANASMAASNATLAATFAGYANSNSTAAATQAGYSAANATLATTQAGYANANAAFAASNATLSATRAGYAQTNATVAQTQAGFATSNAALATSNATLAATFAGYALANSTASQTQAGYSAANATLATTQAGFANSNAAYAASNATLSATRAGYAQTNATVATTQAGYANDNAALAASNATLAATRAGYANSNATLATTQAAYATANAALVFSNVALAASYAANASNAAAFAASNATLSQTRATYAAANVALAQNWSNVAASHAANAIANGAALQASINAVTAAWTSNAAAQALSLTTLTANVAGANASLTTQAGAISTLQGKTAAYLDIVAAAGADPAYLRMNATSYGSNIMLAASAIGLYNTSGSGLKKVMEIVGGNARFSTPVEIQVGSSKLVLGPNFGASSNLVMWFGSNMALTAMTTSNSTFHLKNDGSAYFGGTLAAGVLRNSGQSSGLSATEEFILGPFGTNTGSKSVVVSWSYGITATRDSNPTTRTQTVAATVTLYRSIAGGSYTQVAQQSVGAGGEWTVTAYGDTEAPNPLGGSSGIFDYVAEGIQQLAFTYTDTNTSSGDFRYKAVLSRSGGFTASGTAIGSDVYAQRLGIVSTEQ